MFEVPIDTPPTLRVQCALLVGVAVLAASFALPSLSSGFVFDDDFIIYQDDPGRPLNHLVSEGRYGEILTVSYWYPRDAGLYRPLSILSFAIQYQASAPAVPLPEASARILGVPAEDLPAITLGTPDPRPFHWANLLIHAVTSALVTALILPFGWLPALIGGGLFAVHPVHIETISLVVGRCDLLATAFGALALWMHRRAVVAGRPRAWHWVGIGLAFFLGLVSKEAIAPLPALAFSLDWALSGAGPWVTLKRQARLYGFELGVLVAILLLRGWVLGDFVPSANNVPVIDNPLVEVDALTRFAGALNVLALAMTSLLWPVSQSIDYSFDAVPGVAQGLSTSGLLALTATLIALALAWRARRERPGLLAGLLFFALAYLPVSHLLFPTGTLFGERTVYLPSIGICLFLGTAADCVARSAAGRWLVGIGFVAVLAGCFVLGGSRYPELRSDITAWQSSVEARPGSAKAWFNHTIGAMKADDLEEADVRIERALKQAAGRYPRAFDIAGDIAQRQAAEIDARRDTVESPELRAELDRLFRAALEKAISRFDSMIEAAEFAPKEQRKSFIEEATVRKTELLVLLDRIPAAAQLLDQAVERFPDSVRFVVVRARLELERRHPERAARLCAEALRRLEKSPPDRTSGRAIATLSYLLADAASRLDDGDSARVYSLQAVRRAILERDVSLATTWAEQLDPSVPEAQAVAAIAFSLAGKPEAARESARRARALDPDDPRFRALSNELSR